uniref:ABC transporter subunit C n=1 Tax=Histiona aroides TaxID=392300 RepID=M4QBW5_HISAR|nr:ABC transporter subunit C [Histiona aroides]AGH24079.1 ABC transporter subunit C [Histiona aroides]
MNQQQKANEYVQLTKPGYFLKTSNFIIPLLLTIGSFLFIYGIYIGLMATETDVQQGENYRIVYIHVPAAWVCMLLYLMLTISSALYLIYKHPLTVIISESISKTGALFTFITLVTGSLWGFPTWGTFWVWDARLTSVFILLLLYVGHIAIIINKNTNEKSHKIGAILAIVGFINIPIIKYSVDWWTTLHQGASVTQFKTSIDPTILYPMLIVFISFLVYSLYIVSCNIKRDILHRKATLLKIKYKNII